MADSTLFTDATIISLKDGKPFILRKHSLLVTGNKIAEIAESIAAPKGATVIDCSDKILCPGFVDTHHHLWQTQLKGRIPNDTAVRYMVTAAFQAINYEPEDAYWGQLSGCLEAIDAGTTTVVDFPHNNYSAEHAQRTVDATVDSGLRAVHCYNATLRPESLNPFKMKQELFGDWMLQQYESLAEQSPLDGRVHIGFAFDGIFFGKDACKQVFEQARAANPKRITVHYCESGYGETSHIKTLEDFGLLGPDLLFGHATGASDEEAALLEKHKAHISSTPAIELQMSIGEPMALNPKFRPFASLGIDCQAAVQSSIVNQMQLLLQHERAAYTKKIIAEKKTAGSLPYNVEDAFLLGTVAGARAAGLESEIGSLEVGKKADIVIFDAETPSMLAAAQYDPIAAIVLHSSIRDIDTVMVDGRILKAGGALSPVLQSGGQKVAWKTVAKRVLESQAEIAKKVDQVNVDEVFPEFCKAMYLPEGYVVDV